MFCPHCGSQNSNSATVCSACGMPFDNPYQASMAEPSPMYRGGDVPTYLVQAILTTIFCCQPFGIVAIVYAAQVGSKLAAGDYVGARQSSDSAKMWCWIGVGCWLAMAVVWLIFVVGMGVLGRGR